ncbi:MAG: thioredoxin family protein, partial [Bacteroidales bacterium]
TGSPANEMTLAFPDGRTMRLQEIHSKYTLLIFSNPDCQACKDLLAEYREKVGFQTEIPPQQLAIVSVYPDSDLSVWKKHLKDYPPSWLVCRSPIPDRSAGYDLRAVPALYLLDKDKTVIMKDAPFDKILNYLNNQIQ